MKYLTTNILRNISILAALTVVLLGLLISTASAAQVTQRSLTLSSPIASATNVSYTFRFTINNSYSMGSLAFEFCVEDPLPNEPCTSPNGFDTSSIVLASQGGETGFSIDGVNSTNNRLVLTRTAAVTNPGQSVYQFTGVTNPDSDGSYYARIYTYASTDGTGAQIDDGGIAFAINKPVSVQAEVPPYLFFCVGITITGLTCSGSAGSFLDFGEFTTTDTSFAQSQVMVATNARYGLSISANGTTLTSGNNIIPALAAPTAAATNTSQFGINLRDNSNPNVGEEPAGIGAAYVTANYNTPNLFKFSSGEAIAASTGTSDYKKFTISYMVNVGQNQSPGIYSTTLIYIGLANF